MLEKDLLKLRSIQQDKKEIKKIIDKWLQKEEWEAAQKEIIKLCRLEKREKFFLNKIYESKRKGKKNAARICLL